LWCPSEFSVRLLDPGCLHLRPSSRDWLLVQSSSLAGVSPLLVKRSHFAVGRFLGCVVFQPARFAGHFSASRSSPLFELRLRSECYPALPSQSAAAGRLLSWAFVPYSTSRIRGSLHAGLPARHVPPSGFGFPLDGLHPLIPCRFCFAPAALMGFTLRSFLLSQGIRCSSRPDEPTYRFAYRCSRRRSDGPAQQASVPGFQPFRESLATDKGLIHRSLDAPLGFCPSRVHS
jgi:hypothetical protein